MSIIKHVHGDIVIIKVDDGIYWLKTSRIPIIYDAQLKVVSKNTNHWIKKHTNLTYEQLIALANAYRDGLENGYSLSDVKTISFAMIRATKDAIFKTDLVSEYSSMFWIELLDEKRLNKLICNIRNNFNAIVLKYGKEDFYNTLCRLWQLSNLCYPDKMHVFESMIKNRLNLVPKLPDYPDTFRSDQTIKEIVFGIIFDGRYSEYKNISDSMLELTLKVQEHEPDI